MESIFSRVTETINSVIGPEIKPPTTQPNSPLPKSSSFGPSGANAQTSGFAQVTPPRQPPATGLGIGPSSGGLASSPNVPKPGTSISQLTGKPHTEGLTRAELAAMREKGKGLLDPSPPHEVARRSSYVSKPQSGLSPEKGTDIPRQGRRLSDLSGREQAARQLMAARAAGIVPEEEATSADSGAEQAARQLTGASGGGGTVPENEATSAESEAEQAARQLTGAGGGVESVPEETAASSASGMEQAARQLTGAGGSGGTVPEEKVVSAGSGLGPGPGGLASPGISTPGLVEMPGGWGREYYAAQLLET